MTPQQALQIVDQATAAAKLPRAAHEQVIQALRVLDGIVNPKLAPAEPKA